MSEYKTIDIHGKQYLPVSERVRMAHDSGKLVSISTEVLQHNPIVIKAYVELREPVAGRTTTLALGPIYSTKTFTGISSVASNSTKLIEKMSPYEVAETSAVGRALGFAGFGIEGGIASADEIAKASVASPTPRSSVIKPISGKTFNPPLDPPFESK